MREKVDLLRELGEGAFGEASNREEALRSWAIYFGVAAAAGAFLALGGAFGTGGAPLFGRLAYWIAAMVAGSVIGQTVRIVMTRYLDSYERPFLASFAIALGVAIPGCLFIYLLSRLSFGRVSTSNLPSLFTMVFVVSLAMTALFMLLGRARTRKTAAGPAPPRFLERLPLKLRGAILYAVQAEDHYLRLHTSKGQDLILMRLSDAIAELEGLEGAQVHRSWWVARAGVGDVKRADGKVLLVLKNEAEAPIARGNVRTLKEAGWW